MPCHRRASAGLILAALALALPPAARAAEPADGIEFQDSVTGAMRLGKAAKKVTIVYFTAGWCPWCQKMQTTTLADRAVVALADRFVWAKVDFSKEPDVAAFFGVQSLPHVVLLNARGDTLAAVTGYQSAAQLTELLRRHVDDAEKPGQLRDQIEAAVTGVEQAASLASITDAVRMLARPQRDGRGRLLESLAKLPAAQWPNLLSLMDGGNVATRAAAATALAAATGEDLPFDPFAGPQVRSAQLAAWRTRLAERAATQPAAEPASRPNEQAPAASRPAEEST